MHTWFQFGGCYSRTVRRQQRQLDELKSGRDDANRGLKEFQVAMSQEKMTHSKLKSALLDAEEAHRISVAKLRQELGVMSARSEAAERLLAEASAALRYREAASREFEQRALESSLAAQSKEAALADLEKELNALRATHADVDAARLALLRELGFERFGRPFGALQRNVSVRKRLRETGGAFGGATKGRAGRTGSVRGKDRQTYATVRG
jgi:hypothetical protein